MINENDKPIKPTAPTIGDMMTNPLKHQVGGGHYKGMKIQPIEFCMANELDFVQGSVIKYVTRYKTKNGVEDLKKARHFLDIQIAELEKGNGKEL